MYMKFIIIVLVLLFAVTSCSKKEDIFAANPLETSENKGINTIEVNGNEDIVGANTSVINNSKDALAISISEANVVMISYGLSSNLAYIDSIDDIKKIAELFEEKYLIESDGPFYSDSSKSFLVSFYYSDSSASTRTIRVYDNKHIQSHGENGIYNYTIDDAAIYDNIRDYYDRYKCKI